MLELCTPPCSSPLRERVLIKANLSRAAQSNNRNLFLSVPTRKGAEAKRLKSQKLALHELSSWRRGRILRWVWLRLPNHKGNLEKDRRRTLSWFSQGTQ